MSSHLKLNGLTKPGHLFLIKAWSIQCQRFWLRRLAVIVCWHSRPTLCNTSATLWSRLHGNNKPPPLAAFDRLINWVLYYLSCICSGVCFDFVCLFSIGSTGGDNEPKTETKAAHATWKRNTLWQSFLFAHHTAIFWSTPGNGVSIEDNQVQNRRSLRPMNKVREENFCAHIKDKENPIADTRNSQELFPRSLSVGCPLPQSFVVLSLTISCCFLFLGLISFLSFDKPGSHLSFVTIGQFFALSAPFSRRGWMWSSVRTSSLVISMSLVANGQNGATRLELITLALAGPTDQLPTGHSHCETMSSTSSSSSLGDKKTAINSGVDQPIKQSSWMIKNRKFRWLCACVSGLQTIINPV